MNGPDCEQEPEKVPAELVFLYIHGSAERNPRRAGAGSVALNKGKEFTFSIRTWLGSKTAYQSEYLSLAIGLDLLLRWWDVKTLVVRTNNKLLAKQMRGEWRVRNIELQKLKDEVDRLIDRVTDFRIEQIPRGENEEAIRLSREGIAVIGEYSGYGDQ